MIFMLENRCYEVLLIVHQKHSSLKHDFLFFITYAVGKVEHEYVFLDLEVYNSLCITNL